MKKVLIISDTHGDNAFFQVVLKKVGQPDFFVHCGDIEGTEYYYENIMPCEKIMVMGNNDFFSGLKPIETATVNGLKILAVHGHRHNANWTTESLVELGKDNGAQVVFFGHTHRPKVVCDEETGIWVVNPGSLSYPRQEGRKSSFAVMEVEENGKPQFTINYL